MASEKRGGHREARRTTPRTIDLSADEVRVAGEADAAAPQQAAGPEIAPAAEALVEPSGGPIAGEAALPETEIETAPTMEEKAPEPDAAPRKQSRLRFALPGLAVIALVVAGFGGLYQAGFFSGPAGQTGEPADTGAAAQLEALTGKIAALEQELSGLRAAPGVSAPQFEKLDGEFSGLATRMGKAEQALKAIEAKPPAGEPTGQIQSLVQRLGAAEKALAELGRRAAVAGVAPDTDALEAALAKIAARNDALEAKIAALETGLKARADAADAERRAQAGIAGASIAGALKKAFERGEPFADLLASAEALAGDAPAIGELRARADKGVATLESLQKSFLAAMEAVDAALQPRPEGAVARLLANARLLVRVRPAGPRPGDTPQAVLSRIEAALALGRLEEAVGEWEKLPEPAKPPLQDWVGQLRERIAAGRSLNELLNLLGAGGAG